MGEFEVIGIGSPMTELLFAQGKGNTAHRSSSGWARYLSVFESVCEF